MCVERGITIKHRVELCVTLIVLQEQDEIVKSGLKVLVDGCDISHDTLPVRPLCVHHLIYVLQQRKTE